ncbi:MAG: chemotaxis protein CheW [Dechloromonas sp.]|nr:MAG: chemotaxis protein CheW [Dechloromonas sp.]
MAIYKGIEIDESLAGIIRHMQGVEDYREGLGNLQGAWDILSLLGQLTGSATEMSKTREAFQRLTGDLLNHLGQETRRKAVADLRAKTQSSIDILVRNLFERTADIGFLSADDDIREFLLGSGPRDLMENRFREYVAKYSVYSDIVLFAADGRIAARLSQHPATDSQHPLLAEARSTTAAYVEYFGQADFLPAGQHLLYAYRVTDGDGGFLGVLALNFRLDDEMAGVFGKQIGDGDFTLLATLDADGRVVASSSSIQLPVGTRLEQCRKPTNGALLHLAGRQYLAVSCPAHSYQGYPGPGWLGLGLVPIEFAFAHNDSALLSNVDGNALAAVTQHPTLFSEALRRIPEQAEAIQEDLNRSVWNGSVRQVDNGQTSNAFAKTLLWEIADTGRKTQAVFEQSIGNLHETVVAALLQNAVSRASFAIDVMDRNLYERANDCRWWALNATFRRVLSGSSPDTDERARCTGILRYINGLYTVYDNLILFGAQGQVIAVSNPEAGALVGGHLNEEWVGRCLALNSTQGYVFSPFAPSPLYGNRPTYVYSAAVRAPDDSHVVGGIAIVFDGLPQISAMLNDALPHDANGQPAKESMALFLQRDGKVLASTDERYPAGGNFPLSGVQSHLQHGEFSADIVLLDGSYYALGAAMSAGYREYKTSDGQIDEVLAVILLPLGQATGSQISERRSGSIAASGRSRRVGSGNDVVEIATFYVGGQWLGLPAGDVVEATGTDGMTPILGGNNDLVAGVKMYHGKLIAILYLQRLLTPGAPIPEKARQIVVVRTRNKTCMGLLVDELGEIPEVAREEIQSISHVAYNSDTLTIGVVDGMRRAGDRQGMLSVLAPERFCHRINCRCPPESDGTLVALGDLS